MNDYEIMRVTDPDYEYEMAEIWYKGKLIVVITQETEERKIEIYVGEHDPLILDYKNFTIALTKAHDCLDKSSPLGLVYQQCSLLKNDNVKYVGEEFDSLFKPFQRLGYSITYDFIVFNSFYKSDITITDINTLLATKADAEFLKKTLGMDLPGQENKLNGSLIPISFTRIKENLAHCINHMFINSIRKDIDLSEVTIEKFWHLINQYVTLPPSSCYEYIPTKQGYFYRGNIWRICFVLYDQHGKGVVAHIGACN